jgi:hypothetical protein
VPAKLSASARTTGKWFHFGAKARS